MRVVVMIEAISTMNFSYGNLPANFDADSISWGNISPVAFSVGLSFHGAKRDICT